MTRTPVVTWVLFFAGLCLPLSAGLFRVWLYQSSVQMGYELSLESRRRSDLRERLKELEIELEAERSPEQLARYAAQLKFQNPTPEQIVGKVGGSP